MKLNLVSVSDVSVQDIKILIVPTTANHIRDLDRDLRALDRREIEDYGFSSAKGLWQSYKRGLNNKTLIIDGKVAAVWGVGGSYLGGIGQPWLMTTHAITLISPLRFARL